MVEVIATYPAYASHRMALAMHPVVSSLRFNTIEPVFGQKRKFIRKMREECGDKRLWLDLKTRQLRSTRVSSLPQSEITLSHKISVNTPVAVLFKDRFNGVVFEWMAEEVCGNRIIMRPDFSWVTGAGEAINILAPSLEIDGFFTKADLAYLRLGLHNVMLSFMELEEDLLQTYSLDPAANIIAKIESRRGVSFVENVYPKYSGRVRLMAALDDLYINMGRRKEDILDVLKIIIGMDPDAIAASRILTSLEREESPSMQDIVFLAHLRALGYKRFMLSDGLCANERAVFVALKTLQSLIDKGHI